MPVSRLIYVSFLAFFLIWLFFDPVGANATISVLTSEEYLSVYSPVVLDAWRSRDDLAGVRWEFDDGAVIFGPLAEHRFDSPGPHLVLVETMDREGRRSVEVTQLMIKPKPAGVDLRVTGVLIFDPPPTGNGDGILSPGEWASVRFVVTNAGTQKASRVTAKLILTPDMENELPSEDDVQKITIGDVGPWETVVSEGSLTFSPPWNIDAPHGLWFYLMLEDLEMHRSLPALTIPLGYDEANMREAPFSIEGFLSGNHRTAIFYFRSPQVDQLTVSVSDRGGPLDPRLSLTVPDGTQLSDTDGGYGDDALLMVSNAPEGIYRLDVTGESGTTGTYVVTVDTGATPTDPGRPTIAFGQVVTGRLNSFGEMRAYTFFATEGQRIEALLSDGAGPLDPYLVLRLPSGDEQILDDNSGPGDDALIVVPAAPSTGTYTLIVAGAPDRLTRGAYRLVLAENQEEEHEIHLGETLSGFIHLAGYRVLYHFSNPDLRSFRFLLDDFDPNRGAGGTLDPYLKLFDGDGNLVAVDNNSGLGDDAILVTRIPAGTVEVSGGPYRTVGSYRLRLEEGESAMPILNPGTTKTYVFAHESEVWELSAHAGDSIYIEATDQGGSLDPVLRVESPSGLGLLVVDNNSATDDDARAFLTAPETGTYRVEVSGANGTFGHAWVTLILSQ